MTKLNKNLLIQRSLLEFCIKLYKSICIRLKFSVKNEASVNLN